MKKLSADRFHNAGTAVERRLAAYVAAAGGAATLRSSQADAAIVAHTIDQPFAVNGVVDIDFNLDGQVDFQIDHDRVNLNGNNLDYLQIDKNDINSETNPLPFDDYSDFVGATFPPNSTTPNNATETKYLTSSTGSYPSALQAGEVIGPDAMFDWQESENFLGNTNKWIRANRLIDEDQTQIDQALGGRAPDGVMVPENGPNFVGLNGEVRYLGVEMHLNGASSTDDKFGWIGIRIDNEADATGVVTGWAYESELGVAINAGDIGPAAGHGDYDGDGDSDGNDFLVWQRQLGTAVTPSTGADGDGNGQVDGVDLAVWQGNFGSSGFAALASQSGTTAPVPEPASLLVGVAAALLLALCALMRRVRKPSMST